MAQWLKELSCQLISNISLEYIPFGPSSYLETYQPTAPHPSLTVPHHSHVVVASLLTPSYLFSTLQIDCFFLHNTVFITVHIAEIILS